VVADVVRGDVGGRRLGRSDCGPRGPSLLPNARREAGMTNVEVTDSAGHSVRRIYAPMLAADGR